MLRLFRRLKCYSFFSNSGCDQGFDQLLVNANKLGLDLNIDATFLVIQTLCPRTKKRQFNYERFDDVV